MGTIRFIEIMYLYIIYIYIYTYVFTSLILVCWITSIQFRDCPTNHGWIPESNYFYVSMFPCCPVMNHGSWFSQTTSSMCRWCLLAFPLNPAFIVDFPQASPHLQMMFVVFPIHTIFMVDYLKKTSICRWCWLVFPFNPS